MWRTKNQPVVISNGTHQPGRTRLSGEGISRLKLFGFYKNSGKKHISENVRSWVKSGCQAYLQTSYQSNAYREDGNWLKLTLANQGGYLLQHEQAEVDYKKAKPKQVAGLK